MSKQTDLERAIGKENAEVVRMIGQARLRRYRKAGMPEEKARAAAAADAEQWADGFASGFLTLLDVEERP